MTIYIYIYIYIYNVNICIYIYIYIYIYNGQKWNVVGSINLVEFLGDEYYRAVLYVVGLWWMLLIVALFVIHINQHTMLNIKWQNDTPEHLKYFSIKIIVKFLPAQCCQMILNIFGRWSISSHIHLFRCIKHIFKWSSIDGFFGLKYCQAMLNVVRRSYFGHKILCQKDSTHPNFWIPPLHFTTLLDISIYLHFWTMNIVRRCWMLSGVFLGYDPRLDKQYSTAKKKEQISIILDIIGKDQIWWILECRMLWSGA